MNKIKSLNKSAACLGLSSHFQVESCAKAGIQRSHGRKEHFSLFSHFYVIWELANLGMKYSLGADTISFKCQFLPCELCIFPLLLREMSFQDVTAYRHGPPLALRWQYKPNICEIALSNIGSWQIWVFSSLFLDKKYI